MFVSYAQNFEDVILWRALKDINPGFYIDIGANDPTIDSITKAFYDRGWQGINIEPVSEWFEKLSEERPRDINLQVAAGAKPGEITFYEILKTGLSTASKAVAENYKDTQKYKKIERKVSVRTITNICDEHPITPIHFLKIDVEGAEKQVLEGIDFSKVRPWIVLVEATLPGTQIPTHKDWEPILLSNNYEFTYFDGLNRFYLAKEHPQLKKNFNAPPNAFDNFIRADETVDNLMRASETFATAKAEQLETKTQELTEKIQELATRAEKAEILCTELYASKSWRLTYPLRRLRKLMQQLIHSNTTCEISNHPSEYQNLEKMTPNSHTIYTQLTTAINKKSMKGKKREPTNVL